MSRSLAPGLAAVLLMSLAAPATAQDVRGLEVCTVEKQMDRRTGCHIRGEH